jgi:hypothetical protein
MDLRNMVKNFWSYQPPTPEEDETLNFCRQVNLNKKKKI